MTPAQHKRFYLPAWCRAARRQDWRTRNGRLVATPPVTNPVTVYDALLRTIWTIAEQLAIRDHTAITPNHLRHACHFAALQRHKSSKDFTNQECDRVVALFTLLADPDNLSALEAWSNPIIAARRRLEWAIRRSPDSYVRAISADKFGTRSWEDLPEHSLRQLALTLRLRSPSRPSPSVGERQRVSGRAPVAFSSHDPSIPF